MDKTDTQEACLQHELSDVPDVLIQVPAFPYQPALIRYGGKYFQLEPFTGLEYLLYTEVELFEA